MRLRFLGCNPLKKRGIIQYVRYKLLIVNVLQHILVFKNGILQWKTSHYLSFLSFCYVICFINHSISLVHYALFLGIEIEPPLPSCLFIVGLISTLFFGEYIFFLCTPPKGTSYASSIMAFPMSITAFLKSSSA